MKKLHIFLIILFVLLAILVVIFFIKVPCGGMTNDGTLWDGECSYGSILIENLKNGKFVLPY